MIVKVTVNDSVAYIDNKGEVNGEVKVQGDSPLASHLDRLLNGKLDLTFQGQIESIDPDLLLHQDGIVRLHKASDKYIKEHFIKVECPAFGYTAEVVKE